MTAGTPLPLATGPGQGQAHGSELPMGAFRPRQLTTARVRRRPDSLPNEFGDLLSRGGIPLGSIWLTPNRVRGCWSGAGVTMGARGVCSASRH